MNPSIREDDTRTQNGMHTLGCRKRVNFNMDAEFQESQAIFEAISELPGIGLDNRRKVGAEMKGKASLGFMNGFQRAPD